MRANKLIAVFLFGCSVAGATTAQDHAPSIAQCRADERLWASQDTGPDAFTNITADQLNVRKSEMIDCKAVDSVNQSLYNNMVAEFEGGLLVRMLNFLSRRGLVKQFLDEDEKGAR
jgi:hypothetical protein